METEYFNKADTRSIATGSPRKGKLRNPVQRGQRFHGKGDSNPVKADSR